MVIRVDPERNEIRALKEVRTWRDKKVLEVGCGAGRLTLRLATLHPKSIHAIDPSADLIRTARKNLPTQFAKQIRYQVGSAGELKYPSNSFDITVFSWVL
ncbi:MAG TPA: class I SAM-dependent methyltransferase [Anaerolineales bacterium]